MEYSSDLDRTAWGERISNALRDLYPASAAKSIARDAGSSQRTAEKWLDATATPTLVHFARLIGKHPPLFLVLAPIVTWAPVAVPVVEEIIMQQALAEMPRKRQRAIEAMRAGR